MRVLSNNLLASVKQTLQRKSNYKIYRETENGWKVIDNVKKANVLKAMQSQENHDEVHEQLGQDGSAQDEIKSSNDEIEQARPNYRQNEMKIQMLSQSLYEQIFKNNTKQQIDEQKIKRF